MTDPDDEPLEFCPDSGYPGADPPLFGVPIDRQSMQEIADVANSLPLWLTRNRARLGFELWCLGRIFENELSAVARRHGL